MRVAIDISPLSSGHKVRGVGSYVNLIKNNIEKFDKKNKYIFFENKVPNGIDIVHYPYFDPFFTMLPINKKIKTVVTVHDIIPIVHKKHFPSGIKASLKWQLNKHLLRNVDRIIVDSNASKEDVVKQVGIKANKVDVVYLGVSDKFTQLKTENFQQEIKNKYNLPDEFLLYVGDATWNKNLPRLVEAVKKADLKLVLVGKVWEQDLKNVSPNPWNHDLRKVLKEIDGDERFIRLGFVSDEDIVKIYNLAKVLMMPSLDEGFGLPVLEAMSCGCPVITSKMGSLPEVGGEAAYYVDSNSSDSLAKGITEVWENSKLRQELSKKGLLQAKKFSIEKTIKELVHVYEKVHPDQ